MVTTATAAPPLVLLPPARAPIRLYGRRHLGVTGVHRSGSIARVRRSIVAAGTPPVPERFRLLGKEAVEALAAEAATQRDHERARRIGDHPDRATLLVDGRGPAPVGQAPRVDPAGPVHDPHDAGGRDRLGVQDREAEVGLPPPPAGRDIDRGHVPGPVGDDGPAAGDERDVRGVEGVGRGDGRADVARRRRRSARPRGCSPSRRRTPRPRPRPPPKPARRRPGRGRTGPPRRWRDPSTRRSSGRGPRARR